MREGTKVVIDRLALGRRGMPRFPEAHGMAPPTKVVPVSDGEPQIDHPGLSLLEQVGAERDRRIDSGFSFGGSFYQSRPEDRENIAGAATAALAAMLNGAQAGDFRWHGGDSDFIWIAADNSTHPLDAQSTFAMGQAAMKHKQDHIFAARALKDADPIPPDFADDGHWPSA